MGLVAAVGDNVSGEHLKPGSPAATVTFGGFSEYREVHQLKPFSPLKFTQSCSMHLSFGRILLTTSFLQVLAKHVFSVPAAVPEVVAMLTSGLTASIGLEQVPLFCAIPEQRVIPL